MRARHVVLSALPLVFAAACAAAPPEPLAPPPAPSGPPPLTSASEAPPPPAPPPPPRADGSLLPRATLFGNPERSSPKLSPDGKHLGFLAPENGVMQVFVGPAADPSKARAVTHEKTRGVRQWGFSYLKDTLFFLQDEKGDENWHVRVVDLASGAERDVTPYAGAQARLEAVSPTTPGEIAVGMNDRDKKWHDLYRVDLRTGARKLVAKNEGMSGFVVDHDYHVRYATKPSADGGNDVLEPGPKDMWKTQSHVGLDDGRSTQPLDFDKTGHTLFWFDSRDRDTSALVAFDTRSGKKKVLAEDARADASGVLVHPQTQAVQAAAFTLDHRRWKAIDPAVKDDLDYLRTVTEGDFDVTSRTLDDATWTVSYSPSDGPIRHYRYDRKGKSRHATLLFVSNKALEGAKLAKMTPVAIKSRDGLELWSFLTLPRGSDADGDGKPDKPIPLVLTVHGGPWARDSWGYSPTHQWLASRGYAVLSVNYRGSTGFGKKHVAAANLEWAGKMHDDLLDAVAWAVDGKITDKSQVAIMGGSYGGYATLVGLTFTPETFACGVDIVGPSNLETLLATVPPYWASIYEEFAHRIGDPRTDAGKKLLADRSPLTKVDKIVKPLLIGQGANDPRVKQSESDQIVKAMQAKGIPVSYVLYSDEGHGFARPENRLSFYATAEVFLAQCLGGPYQPVGDDFKGSTIAIPQGAERLYGVAESLKR
jgi:dipeptidyl aminopeptidase/acylaminoacyl peptidase